MFREDEEGIALVMVLILLVVIGTLAAVLLRSARTHTDVAVQEEVRSQAFHSAEAGVEFVKANSREAFGKINQNDEGSFIVDSNDNDDNITIVEENDWVDFDENNIEFRIEIDKVDEEDITFLSEGRDDFYNETINKKIEFSMASGPSFLNTININERESEFEDHFSLQGKGSYVDQIHLTEWPDYEENFWEPYLKENAFKEEFDEYNEYLLDEGLELEQRYYDDSLEIELQGTDEIIDNSFLIVDGNIEMQTQAEFVDSIVMVKDYVVFRGNATFDNTLLLIYGEDKYEHNPQQSGYLSDDGTEATIIFRDTLPAAGFEETFNIDPFIEDPETGDLNLRSWEQQ